MPRESDRFREYVDDLENRKWRCTFCKEKFAGSTPRIRAHLAGIPGRGIKACKEVKDAVRAEALETFYGKGSGLDKSTGGTLGKGMEGTVFGASQSVLPSEGALNPNGTQNSNQHGCVPQQQSFYWPAGTGIASAWPKDHVSLPPSDMPLDNLDNTQQSDPSNHWLDAAHGNENASSLQPLSSLYISEPPVLPELSTHLEFGTGTPPACPQYEVSLPQKDKSTGGTSGEGTEGIDFGASQSVLPSDDASNPNDMQNWNQLGCAPQQQSFYLPTGASIAPACPEDQGSLPPGNIFPDILDNTQQSDPSNRRLNAAHGNEIALSLQQLLMDLSSSPSDDLLLGDGVTLDTWLYSPENLHDSLPENRLESHNVDVSTSEEIQTNELHNPTAGSSVQMDPSLDVDRENGLQDCVQPCVVEGVPARSNTSPTGTVQHPCQLPQRCDKEDGNDICRFPSQTPMVIDPSATLQHPTDSHIFEATNVHLLVPGTSTNPIGPSSSHGLVPPLRQIVPHRSINLQTVHQNPTVPSSSWENRLVTGHPQALVDMDPCMPSSSQSPNHAPRPPQILPCGTGLIGPSSLPESDMNEGAPMTSHPNTYNIFEESGALKRKLEQLFSKEAHIREELKFGASLSLKKPRMEVANWLVDVEKLRNDCLLPHQVDILMCEAEDFWRQGKGLFETRETKVNNLIIEKMLGETFQRNTTKILQYLEGNKISRLGIYGMGGVGKTTMMVHIHNRLLEEANYGDVLWITVSQDFKTPKLQDTIWEALDLGKLQENDVRKRAAMLCDCLTEKGKSTIILDDVWEHFDLNEVGIPVGADGIKLVLTTRSFEVCCQMHCQEMIKIEPLSQIEAESLFLEELGFEVAFNMETRAVVKSFVQECAGLPLAVITMARSMRGVTDVFEWKDSLEKVRASDMGQTDMENVFLKKLALSYDRLGKYEVQQCFLFCALYPEDQLIDKFKLIEFFIDQGLIGRLNTREKQYDRGLTILNKLEDACLLEDYGSAIKMHDLIRDMALQVMTSISGAKVGLRRIPSEDYWTDTSEEVSLMHNEIGELPGPSSLPELDVNEGAPMTSHLNTGNKFEETMALKRKLELLHNKEASIRDELEFAASLSLKKPRMEVANWLVNVEKLRNDHPKATSEDCLPPHQQVDMLMHEAEDLMRQRKGLFEAREIKVNKLLEEKMVGEAFWRNTTKILEHLVGNQISRLGIYGMGGVGKTTMMVHIHNRLLEEANYGNVLWITVSQDFKTRKLQDTIWEALNLGKLQENDVRKRAAMLCDCLTEKGKSTIILDDVWECFDLKEVGIPVGADAIKLVLTTRSFEVCRQMQCQEMIKIKPLSQMEAEGLFLEELGFEVAFNMETRAVVKSFVQECAGLPLAVITMARSMRGVTDVFEWKDCLEKLRESDLGLMDVGKEVLMKLEFSYNRLGNDEVQQCFLSCAFYPEDELIDKFELIEFFIDQGLIGRLNTREKQYDRGLTILNKLENVCLLEDYGSAMKMHDLIRDMALQIMRATSIVKAGKGLRRIPSEDYWTDALEKVSLMQNEIREFPLNMSPNCPELSTFLLNANYLNDVVIPDSFFKQLWGLKVLNLSRCNLRELPDSISDLVNLRALLLRYCWGLCRIPYLGKLRYLRKLDLYYCASLEAIRDLEMLVNLRYLDLSGTRIERLPKGTLGALLNLQYLKVEAVNVEDFTKLRALETLECSFEDVDDFNKFVRVVSKQGNNLRYYKLNVREEASDIYVQVSDHARFRNYDRSVHIKTWSYAIVSARGESGGNCILIPQDVRSLTASKCDGKTKLSGMGPLENLEKLNIVGWKNLWVLCGGQDEEIIDICDSPAPTPTPLIFPSLRVLKISDCPKLKYLFGHGPKFSLPHLQKIDISYCEQMVGITVADTLPPLHPPPAFSSLEDITVWSCPKMKRVVESESLPHLPNLRRLKVSFCGNMEEIIGGPSLYMPAEEVSLEGSIITAVDNTPSSSQPSISLPKLKSLWLSNLPQLKSICEVPLTCDSMEFFKVSNCPELNGIPSCELSI